MKGWVKAHSSHTHPGADDGFPAKAWYGYTKELPQVPKGTLSGLLSFIRGGVTRSQWDRSKTQIRERQVEELYSVDYSYHAYLNPNYPGSIANGNTSSVDTRLAYV